MNGGENMKGPQLRALIIVVLFFVAIGIAIVKADEQTKIPQDPVFGRTMRPTPPPYF